MNNIDSIKRILKDAGLNARIEDNMIYLEDPSCITRGFENFLHYAWDILLIITIFLIIGWAYTIIRGAKNDIKENMKSLVLIFGILTVSIPILNIVFGRDLMGVGCKELSVPISEINEILDTRSGAQALNAELYEDMDIYDSGPTKIWVDDE
jgi:hypothetical protein